MNSEKELTLDEIKSLLLESGFFEKRKDEYWPKDFGDNTFLFTMDWKFGEENQKMFIGLDLSTRSKKEIYN